MTLHFSSKECLKYKIYDIIDGKKKFAKKGRFTGEKSVEFTPKGTQFAVRVLRWKSFFNPLTLMGSFIIMLFFEQFEANGLKNLPETYAKEITVSCNNQSDVDFLYDRLHDEFSCSNACYVQNRVFDITYPVASVICYLLLFAIVGISIFAVKS